MRNKNFSMISLVVVPLLLALAIYFHWQLPRSVGSWLDRYVGHVSLWGPFGSTTQRLVVDFGAVFFLSFALASLLLLATRVGRSLYTLAFLVAIAALFEFSQSLAVIPGLFDPWDFAVEAVAVSLAYFFYWTGNINA